MLEKDLQKKILRFLKDRGIYSLNLFGDGWSAKGKPDVIICLNGKFVAFELKVGKNGLSEDQKIHKNRIERSGGKHYAPYTFEEFLKIYEELTT